MTDRVNYETNPISSKLLKNHPTALWKTRRHPPELQPDPLPSTLFLPRKRQPGRTDAARVNPAALSGVRNTLRQVQSEPETAQLAPSGRW
jgi:hypothetical protein